MIVGEVKMKMKCFFAIWFLAMCAMSGEIRVQLMPEEARHLGACWIIQGKQCKSNESQIVLFSKGWPSTAVPITPRSITATAAIRNAIKKAFIIPTMIEP